MKTALLLEDYEETRTWLACIVRASFDEIEIFEAATLEQARAVIHNQKIDLALIDINLPDGNGVDFVRDVINVSPQTYCVMATIYDDDAHIFPALKAGAQGYLLKEQSTNDFISALQGIINGEPPLSPAIARRMMSYFAADEVVDKAAKLSEREKEILTFIAKGLKRNEVAALLELSPNTVAAHLKRIYNKLSVSTRAEATLEALRMGLVNVTN